MPKVPRTLVVDWCCEGRALLQTAGYEHNKVVEGDPFEIAKKLFEVGLNVLVMRTTQNAVAQYVVGVDTRRFQTR